MILAQLTYDDFNGMTVADIKEMLNGMFDDAVFNLIPANHCGDAEHLEVTYNSKGETNG